MSDAEIPVTWTSAEQHLENLRAQTLESDARADRYAVGGAPSPVLLPGVAEENIAAGQEVTYDMATGRVRLRRVE